MRGAFEFLAFLNPVSWFAEKGGYQPSQCQVRAWVRAQDLQPNATSLGELRVKLLPPCIASMSSLTLELRLEEIMRDDRVVGTTRSFSEAARIAWMSTLDLLASDDVSLKHSFLDGAVFPFNIVTPNVNYPAGTNADFYASSQQNMHSFFNTRASYLYKVTAGFTDGSSREVTAGWTTFHPCRSEVLDTSPVQLQTVATSLRGGDLLDEDLPRQERRFAGAVNVTVNFPRGAIIEQNGFLELDISLNDSRDMELPAVQVAVLPSLRQSIEPSFPEHASFFNIRGFSRAQELRAAIRPPFSKATLGQSLPRSANVRLHQETDLGPVPPELASVRFLLRADELLPGGFRGMWGTPSAVLYMRLEVGPENTSKRDLIDNQPAAAFCDMEGGWEIGHCNAYPDTRDVIIFEADVPIAVAHRACPAGVELPTHYLDNDGLNPKPVLARGHATPAKIDPQFASPRLETRVKKLFKNYDLTSGPCMLFDDHEILDEVEMHFAGTLWERSKLMGNPQPKPRYNSTETGSHIPCVDSNKDFPNKCLGDE